MSLLKNLANAFCISLLVASVACATKQPGSEAPEPSEVQAFTIPDFGEVRHPQTRTDFISRFGPPATQEKYGRKQQYDLLYYPLRNQSDRLIVVFVGESFHGCGRASTRSSIFANLDSEDRATAGQIRLYSLMSDGKRTEFFADLTQLQTLPRWAPNSRSDPPLSSEKAQTLALDWLRKIEPDRNATAQRRQTYEVSSVPGASFYVVGLMLDTGPDRFREVVILMDGTVISGEAPNQ